MLWRLYFEILDFIAGFIPNKKLRERVRHVHLYDYRRKFNALRNIIPNREFKNIRIIKGGWNIGFIVDNKYVCKIRKAFDKSTPTERIMREKRITDTFRSIVPLKIPQIDIIESNGFTFYKYNFIPGKNLNRMSKRTIIKHGWEWGTQLAEFIYAMHNYDTPDIADLKDGAGDGWNHNDICNNIIVNPKTMKIVGLIDWEYAGWGTLDTEFKNCTAFSKKIENAGLGVAIQIHYHILSKKKKK
ncbi:MAG: hypothetical protein IKW67_00855 [Alphaproteobacteria bacterium]|nr:hypothetical protein [Alphaproteobacteria bacterium]